MFPQNDMTALGPDQLVPKLLAGIDNTSGLPAEFVEELANRFANDGLETVGSSVIGRNLFVSIWLADHILDFRRSFGDHLAKACEHNYSG